MGRNGASRAMGARVLGDVGLLSGKHRDGELGHHRIRRLRLAEVACMMVVEVTMVRVRCVESGERGDE